MRHGARRDSGRRPPKRILPLGGGGVRGLLSVIEDILKERAGRGEFRLSDYFTLIGGTSIGSIIAFTLACGMSVAELKTRAQGLSLVNENVVGTAT